MFQPLKIFQSFREALYKLIPFRRDATMDVLDALASNPGVDSVVKISLSNRHPRTYNSIGDAVKNFS